jgi:hypothetical protein
MENTITQEKHLNPLLKNRQLALGLLSISLLLMSIDNFLKMPYLIGGWHIVLYLLLLMPLGYLVWKKEIKNPYTKWFIPFLLVMIGDMFYYNNDMAQFSLPIIFYILIIILYTTSMHEVEALYQTLLPRLTLKLRLFTYIKEFFDGLVHFRQDKTFYHRIGTALMITLPFLGMFVALLTGADSHYSSVLGSLFRFPSSLSLEYFITVPLYFITYLFLFLYSFSNHTIRTINHDTKKLDLLIVGIFLGMINLLFISFVAMQIPFLFSSDYLPAHTNIANFAREGFFQLMMVMGLVSLIFLFILRRYKGEKLITIMLIGLLVQSIVMGIVSLKKMHIYQSIKGATVLRYYVEWFDYFLILVLLLGIIFLIRKYAFTTLVNMITILGMSAFTIIVSLNIDGMVAKHNIEKFQTTPEMLDKEALHWLSIDALPIVSKYHIELKVKEDYRGKENTFYPWYIQQERKNCDSFKTYHYGYCSKLKKYGK